MNRNESKRAADDAAARHESSEAGTRSGEGAATALQAMLRNRQQAERPELPGIDTPPRPQP